MKTSASCDLKRYAHTAQHLPPICNGLVHLMATRGASQVQELRANGRDPYAYGWPRTHTTVQLQQQYADLAAGEQIDDVEVRHTRIPYTHSSMHLLRLLPGIQCVHACMHAAHL